MSRHIETHRDGEVGVGEHLEIKRLVALVCHTEHGPQATLAQGDAVLQAEIIRPGLLHLFTQVVRSETEIESHGIVTALGERA